MQKLLRPKKRKKRAVPRKRRKGWARSCVTVKHRPARRRERLFGGPRRAAGPGGRAPRTAARRRRGVPGGGPGRRGRALPVGGAAAGGPANETPLISITATPVPRGRPMGARLRSGFLGPLPRSGGGRPAWAECPQVPQLLLSLVPFRQVGGVETERFWRGNPRCRPREAPFSFLKG